MDTKLAELKDITGTDDPFWRPRRQLLTLHGTLSVIVDTVSGRVVCVMVYSVFLCMQSIRHFSCGDS